MRARLMYLVRDFSSNMKRFINSLMVACRRGRYEQERARRIAIDGSTGASVAAIASCVTIVECRIQSCVDPTLLIRAECVGQRRSVAASPAKALPALWRPSHPAGSFVNPDPYALNPKWLVAGSRCCGSYRPGGRELGGGAKKHRSRVIAIALFVANVD